MHMAMAQVMPVGEQVLDGDGSAEVFYRGHVFTGADCYLDACEAIT
jgi:hypothetical protein